MRRLNVGEAAPDFALPDEQGRLVRLSDVLQEKNALLVFNIGFV